MDRRWQAEANRVRAIVRKVTDEMRASWLSESGEDLLQTFVTEVIDAWKPEVSPKEIDAGEKRENA